MSAEYNRNYYHQKQKHKCYTILCESCECFIDSRFKKKHELTLKHKKGLERIYRLKKTLTKEEFKHQCLCDYNKYFPELESN